MKSAVDEISQRVLLLLKIDSRRLFERIKYRKPEYLGVFAMKRSRDHFPEVFRNRYAGMSIDDLKHCGQETIVALDNFYSKVDEVRWYLYHTEDMPQTLEDSLVHMIKDLEKLHETLNLYIDAELGYQVE